MARKRMIDPKFWNDSKITNLDYKHRLMFIGIWNFCDDQGIHRNDGRELKAEIFPCDDISISEIEEMVETLSSVGLIYKFENQGVDLFHVRKWKVYQSIQKPIPSRYSLPTDYDIDTIPLQTNRIEYNRIEHNKTKQVVGLKQLIKTKKQEAKFNKNRS